MNSAAHISAIPPRDWLVYALLIYDSVHINDEARSYLETTANAVGHQISAESAQSLIFLMELINNDRLSQIFASSRLLSIDAAIKLTLDDHQAGAEQYAFGSVSALYALDLPSDYFTYKSSSERIASHLHHSEKFFPNTDVYIPIDSQLPNDAQSSQITYTAIRQLVPLELKAIEPSQILDFRQANKSNRVELIKASDGLINDIMMSTTKADANRLSRELADHMRDHLQRMRKQYKTCNIKTTLKSLGAVSSGSVGSLGLIHSLAHLAIDPTSAAVTTIAVLIGQSIVDDQSNREALKTDKWAYLWNLDRSKMSRH